MKQRLLVLILLVASCQVVGVNRVVTTGFDLESLLPAGYEVVYEGSSVEAVESNVEYQSKLWAVAGPNSDGLDVIIRRLEEDGFIEREPLLEDRWWTRELLSEDTFVALAVMNDDWIAEVDPPIDLDVADDLLGEISNRSVLFVSASAIGD